MKIKVSNSIFCEESLLDVPFVGDAVKRLKCKKSAGPDNLLAEHVIEGGQCVVSWLTVILNC